MPFFSWFRRPPKTDVEIMKAANNVAGLLEIVRLMQGEKGTDTHYQAIEALGDLGNAAAAEPLIHLMGHHDSEIRRRAASALGKIRDRKVVEPLIAAMRDENSGVRGATVEALGKIGDSRMIPALVAILEGPYDLEREAAAVTLSQMADSESVRLHISRIAARNSSILAAVSKIGEPALEFLIGVIREGGGKARRRASLALAAISDPRAVDRLIQALGDSEEKVRWAAARALGNTPHPAALEPLVAILNDQSLKVREGAVEALGSFVSPIAEEALLSALHHFSSDIRAAASGSLGRMGTPRAISSLLQTLGDRDSCVRERAAKSLARIGEKAIYQIRQVLKDDNWHVRVRATAILGKIKTTGAVEPLIEALSDEVSHVREEAVKGLAERNDPKAVDSLIQALKDESWDVREAAAEAVGETSDPKVVRPLIQALKQGVPGAARALGIMRAIKAVDALIEALGADDRSVRAAAAEALGEIRDARAVKPLAGLLGDKDVGRDAAESLQKIGAPSVAYFATGLASDDPDVRSRAAAALGQVGDESAVKPLHKNLVDWHSNRDVGEALHYLGWRPVSDEDKVHFLVARRKRWELRDDWNLTKRVLLNDVSSGDYRTVENALYAFIGIGFQEIIPELVANLSRKGNKVMAEAFLNCGEKELGNAARQWAAIRGYVIIKGSGAHPVSWGFM